MIKTEIPRGPTVNTPSVELLQGELTPNLLRVELSFVKCGDDGDSGIRFSSRLNLRLFSSRGVCTRLAKFI